MKVCHMDKFESFSPCSLIDLFVQLINEVIILNFTRFILYYLLDSLIRVDLNIFFILFTKFK